MQKANQQLLASWIDKADKCEIIDVSSDLSLEIILRCLFSDDMDKLIKQEGKNPFEILTDAFEKGEYDEALSEIKSLSQPHEITADEELSPLKHKLKTICNSIVEGCTLDVNDNFFESGISSLMLTEIHQQIDDRYPDKVDVVDLFEYQTITELAGFMQDKI